MIRAYYGLKNGGSGVRQIRSAAEAEKILKGGYNATTVRLEDCQGNVIGQRWKEIEHRRLRWFWSFEADAFKGCNDSPDD